MEPKSLGRSLLMIQSATLRDFLSSTPLIFSKAVECTNSLTFKFTNILHSLQSSKLKYFLPNISLKAQSFSPKIKSSTSSLGNKKLSSDISIPMNQMTSSGWVLSNGSLRDGESLIITLTPFDLHRPSSQGMSGRGTSLIKNKIWAPYFLGAVISRVVGIGSSLATSGVK